MKNFTKAIALCMALLLCLSFPVGVSAAEVADATIDFTKTGSLTIYKIDLTNAEKDGAWDSSYVSTGVYDQNVYDALIGATRDGDTDNTSDLGNGEKSYGYAIAGVEFSYLKVADIVQFSESTADGRTDNHVEVLYGIDKVKGADFLKALGLENGAERYANADQLDSTKYFYQSDVLIDALAAGLEANSTTVKNALEKYMAANGGIKMAPTNAYGKTEAIDLELGLYLCVETAVPEMVVSTTNPFLVSLPMTSVNGTNATDGGTRWIYDVTTFPKNLTGIPELEKTLRENINDTGKNNGSSTDITDGYAHTGTASAGDVIDYQIISTLPSITSESTYLTCYTFIDTLSKGLTYNKNDVVLEFFTDEACTDLVTTWKQADGYFTVTYGTTNAGESVMTIEMTSRGLAEINSSKAVYPGANMVNSGYSDCTLRITYQATMDSDNSVVFGDEGNPNDVVLTWKRSNTSYYDTLVDDAHVFTYGIELTKLFSDGQGNLGCWLLPLGMSCTESTATTGSIGKEAVMSGRKNRSAGKTILLMLYVLLFLSGLSLLLYPKLNAIWIDYMLHRDAAEFLSFVYTDAYIPREDASHVIIRNPEPTEPEETLPDEYPELWQQMRAYNEDIFRNGQEGLSGETAYEKPSFILADYGLESEVFAVLSIPKLDLSAAVVKNLLDKLGGSNHFLIAASLTVGVVKLDAVVYWSNGKYSLGYDLMVKDAPDSNEWICYENLQEEVRYNVWNLEREMFQVLDRAVLQFGLSYTECNFQKLDDDGLKNKE